METEPRSSPPQLQELIQRAGGISAAARALGLSYVTVHAWARGYHPPCEVNLLRLMELPASTVDGTRPIPPLRPRLLPPSDQQRALIRDTIRRAGGRAVVSRALGVTYVCVRSWDLGQSAPRGDRLQRLLALPEGLPLPPGRPRRRRLADHSLIDHVVDLAGNLRAAARALGIHRSTVRRYVRRQSELSSAVVERARELLTANGVKMAPEEQRSS